MMLNVQANAKPSYFVPQSVLVLEKAYSEIGIPPPHENSNNPLAAEPESENDATRFFPKTLSKLTSVGAAVSGTTKGFIQMIKTLMRTKTLGPLLATALFAIAAPALAQTPTQSQRDAVKSQCRNDYIAHCSSVPPGGEASLQCLQKNMSSLSSSCQGAVRALAAPAAVAPAKPAEAAKPADTAAPAATASKSGEPKAAAVPAAGQPSSAQISAIRSACRSDYPKVCAGVPTGGAGPWRPLGSITGMTLACAYGWPKRVAKSGTVACSPGLSRNTNWAART